MTHAATVAREDLERRWRPRLALDPSLATQVTAQGAQREPFHRWLPYRQGYSPALVRRFLHENPGLAERAKKHPLLDPFAGSGTFVVECARQRVEARGVEAAASLVFVANAKHEREWSALPDFGAVEEWTQAAERLELPLHRAALMLAVARGHTAEGRPNRGAPALPLLLRQVSDMMREDLARPLPRSNPTDVGDARTLAPLGAGAIGGVLTSPPYLSRHDYARVTAPLENVHRFWYPAAAPGAAASAQLPASPRAAISAPGSPVPPAAEEASVELAGFGETRLAKVVRSYFSDLADVLAALRRVLAPGGDCWMVLGGARMKGVYVPSDLIAADMAETAGFTVAAIRVARDLIDGRRKLGGAGAVAPRESLLVLSA